MSTKEQIEGLKTHDMSFNRIEELDLGTKNKGNINQETCSKVKLLRSLGCFTSSLFLATNLSSCAYLFPSNWTSKEVDLTENNSPEILEKMLQNAGNYFGCGTPNFVLEQSGLNNQFGQAIISSNFPYNGRNPLEPQKYDPNGQPIPRKFVDGTLLTIEDSDRLCNALEIQSAPVPISSGKVIKILSENGHPPKKVVTYDGSFKYVSR